MTAGVYGPRYPFDRLAALLGHPTSPEIALRLGVTRDAVEAWKRRGLSERMADEVATALGFWPGSVWPDWLREVEPEQHLVSA